MTVSHPHCCLWAGTRSFLPSALETQRRLTQGSSPNLHRYCNTPVTRNHADDLSKHLKRHRWKLHKNTADWIHWSLTVVFVLSFRATAPQRSFQPCTQCDKRRSWQFSTKRSPPPPGHLLSPQHHSHIQGQLLFIVVYLANCLRIKRFVWPIFFPPSPSRTLRTVVPLQYWTTSGRGGRAEPLWPQVRHSTWLV